MSQLRFKYRLPRQIVRTGADIDLSTLPFHLQHDQDGAPYISSAIDFGVPVKDSPP